MAGPWRVTLYERDGCHLCEEVRVLLDEMLAQDGYTRIDIEADDELVLRSMLGTLVFGIWLSDELERAD